jgi:hypothetical protein
MPAINKVLGAPSPRVHSPEDVGDALKERIDRAWSALDDTSRSLVAALVDRLARGDR